MLYEKFVEVMKTKGNDDKVIVAKTCKLIQAYTEELKPYMLETVNGVEKGH